MSSVSLMEWNGKPHLQWDWENLIMFNAITNENSKQLSLTDLEADGEKGNDSGFFYSSGSASRSRGSISDLELASFSKSASTNSSSAGEVKTSNFTLEASKINPSDYNKEELVKAKATGTSPTLEASVGSGDQLLGLKLGKRTYFEDASAGSNAQSSAVSTIHVPSSFTPAKKLKSGNHSQRAPRCQVQDCNLDLSSAKDYHRKHRVCESHSKCPKVIVAGLERRFCQQCSRFHGLSEFDEKKKSCRRRLSDHNARRRKQPGSVHLNPSRLSSSLYDERQQMSHVWDKAPLVHSRPNANLTWESTSASKFTITKEYIAKPAEIGDSDRRFHMPGIDLTNSNAIQHHHKSNGFLPSKVKGTAGEVLNQGLDYSLYPSKAEATPEFHRALSLLSIDSRGSCEPQSISFEQPMHTNHTSMPQSVLHAVPQSSPLALSEYWRTEQQSNDPQVHALGSRTDGSNYLQEFQLFRTSNGNDFYSSHMN